MKNGKVIAGKLTNLATTCSPYLSPENVSEIQTLLKEDDLSLASEKLMTGIMDQSIPLPEPLRSIDWKDCLELGVNLGLGEEWKNIQLFGRLCSPYFANYLDDYLVSMTDTNMQNVTGS